LAFIVLVVRKYLLSVYINLQTLIVDDLYLWAMPVCLATTWCVNFVQSLKAMMLVQNYVETVKFTLIHHFVCYIHFFNNVTINARNKCCH